MTKPAPLGRGLGRSLAIATSIGMIVFGTILAATIYNFEVGGQCEETPGELVKQSLLAFTFAGPIGVTLALLVGRQLIRRTTERLDDVIASASRMTGERLDERLPIRGTDDALDRLAAALNDLLFRIESGVAAQRQFAADASHELRTPLAVISTKLEVARRKQREGAHWEHVADETLGEVRRMNDLVDKLLELSRAGAAGLHLERADLHTLAQAAAGRAQAIAGDRRVSVEVSGMSAYALVDRDALGIVFDNLVRNAIAHTVEPGQIDLVVGPGPQFAVEDRGPGIPVALRTRIFEPFARGLHETSDRADGTTGLGLGLAICKRIVTGHRGTIVVDERPGGGARFIVTLPAA